MFGGKRFTLAKFLSIARAHVVLNPFSLWAVHGGWFATVTLVGAIVTIKAITLFLAQNTYIDPFVRYDAIMPGNRIGALINYHCFTNQSRSNEEPITSIFSCAISPEKSVFDTIHIEGKYGFITELKIYANNVKIGDLLLHWKPLTRPIIVSSILRWNTSNYSVEVLGNDTQYDHKVRVITVHHIAAH